MNSAEQERVGFVAIGRNEGDRLADSLRVLLANSDQVVYVDSGSTDGSVELATDLGAIVVALDNSTPHTAAKGRNAGFREICRRFPTCEFVQFIDGDCILQPNWIRTAITFMQTQLKAAVVCGRRFEREPKASLYNRLIDEEWNTPIGISEYCGGDAFVRRCAFEQIGGFRPELTAGEEPEMTGRMRAAGWEVWRVDALMTEHDAKITRLAEWWRRTQRGGFAYAQVWSSGNYLVRRLFRRRLASAIFWTLFLPAAFVFLSIAAGTAEVLLVLPLVYGLQVARVASRKHLLSTESWKFGAMLVLAKIPEATGILRFIAGRTLDPSHYKELRWIQGRAK